MAITIGPGIDFGPGISVGGGIPLPAAGSAYFSNTSAYLNVQNSSEFSFGTDDFTIETWLYSTGDTSVNRRFFSLATNANNQICFRRTTTDTIRFFVMTSGTFRVSLTTATTLNAAAWNHCAIVRSGLTFRMYLNGSIVDTDTTFSGAMPNLTAGSFYIGNGSNAGEGNGSWLGYMSNYRIVNGTAVYTGAYTVPTDVFTATQSANPFGGSNTSAISAGQTKLLLNFNYNDLLTDSSGYSVPVTNIGSPNVATNALNPF